VPERTQPMAAAVPASQPVPEPRKGRIAGNVGALRKALGATPPPAAAEKKEIARPALRRPSVLFVDDEERVLNALASVFNDQYEVETFTGGRAALERLKQRRFHVLVSDQRMPEMVGVELLREAKTLAPGTVRLLLTGYSDLAAIVGSVNESEVFRFVSKPWQEEDLKATLAEAVDVAIALEVAALAPAPAIPADSTVLVMGEPALARGVRELAKSAYQVREAPGMDAALELLAAEEVAVLVCDIDGAGDPAALLRVLKEQSPRTQLIAVSAAADSEQVIGLINEARIVRFLAKPVNLSLLQSALGAALQRAARVRKTPEWLRSEAAKKRREASAAERSLLGRLKGLGGRFAAVLRG
jgi:response regulator RpfG family c-di-GMP phosphodiesterase